MTLVRDGHVEPPFIVVVNNFSSPNPPLVVGEGGSQSVEMILTATKLTSDWVQTITMTAYKRTATRSLRAIADVYEKTIPEEAITQTRRESSYLHLLHLPDHHDPRDVKTGTPLEHSEAYELAVRDPLTITEHGSGPQPISHIRELSEPFELERALNQLLERAESKELPIYDEIHTLRPTHWSDAASWVSCPDCASGTITLVTDLDAEGVIFACRECDARIDESDRQTMFQDWLHCPSCNSGDVNIELSAPLGSVWWSCDDCLYDTSPAPIEPAYTDTLLDETHQ